MNNTGIDLQLDVAAVDKISIVPAILEVVCRTTGMGFAAVARVTTEQWVACAVRDEIKFGLLPGGELKLDTTICHEIRQSGTEVVIDHVAQDNYYAQHHTPAMYGFQSYISVPLRRQDKSFFGTLCAIDPSPAILNTPEIVGMFKTYAELISVHLNAVENLSADQVKSLEAHTNLELDQQLATVKAIGNPDKKSKEFITTIASLSGKIDSLIIELKDFFKVGA